MLAPDQIRFRGWTARNKYCLDGQKLEEQDFTPRAFTESDVDIRISHCGVCGSDLHTLRSGWAETVFPICVGHEIIGTVVRIGEDVEDLALGDRVGVGAQVASCLRRDCTQCSSENEQYCGKMVETYGSVSPDRQNAGNADTGWFGLTDWTGSVSMGGYGDYARVDGQFVFKIPDGLPSEIAAPMMCAGITMYSALKRNGAGPGKVVGIVGHFGLLWARALGCTEVVAISHHSEKADDGRILGATVFVAAKRDAKWADKHVNSIDVLICTSYDPQLPIEEYFRVLKPHGTLVQVGAPECGFPAFNFFPMLRKGLKISGSLIGSPAEIEEMLQLAVEKGVRSWIEVWPMRKVNQALAAFNRGQPRYRFVLANEKHLKGSVVS